MKSMSGFSSETSNSEGKADSVLPSTDFKDTEEIKEKSLGVTHIDAFGEAKTLEEPPVEGSWEPAKVLEAVATETEEKEDETKKSFFKSIKFEDDDDFEVEEECVADAKVVEPVEPVAEPKVESKVEQVVETRVEPKVEQVVEPKVEPKTATKLDGFMNKVDDINQHPIQVMAKGLGGVYGLLSKVIKRVSFSRLTKKSVKVQSGDFEFAKASNYLIVTKYSGISNSVLIPAYVGNLPVKYIHPDFLYSGVNPFDNYKVRSIVSAFKGISSTALEEDLENEFLSDVTEIQLPNTLVAISDSTFVGCTGVKELIIPESVKSFNYNAIKGSGITTLYFNGSMPRGFNLKKFKGNVFVKEG